MMTKSEIQKVRGHLLVKGLTPKLIAEELEVSRSAVAQAITGACRSDRIQKFIAKKIGYWPWAQKPGERFQRPA